MRIRNEALNGRFYFYTVAFIFILIIIYTIFSSGNLSISEKLNATADIATAIGITVAAWQIHLTHQQSITDFENSLSKQYREIAATLPTKVLLGEKLTDTEYEIYFDTIYRYIDFCNEQAFLFQNNRISKSTWIFWLDGIVCHLKLPTLEHAWRDISSKSPDKFSELRSALPKNSGD